ncbi:MAG: hypothetical protein VCB77_02090 [Alphaproteobacteria bacterium]
MSAFEGKADIILLDGQLQIELIGDLATLLGFAEKKGADNKKPGSLGDPAPDIPETTLQPSHSTHIPSK